MVQKGTIYDQHNHDGYVDDGKDDDDNDGDVNGDDQYHMIRNRRSNSVIEKEPIHSTLSSSDNLKDEDVINPLQQIEKPSHDIDTSNDHHHHQDQRTISSLIYEAPIAMAGLSHKAKELQLKTIQRLNQAAESLSFTTTNKNIAKSNANIAILEKYNKDELQKLLNKRITVTNQSIININYFPSIVQHFTGIEDIYVLFEMVHVNCIFVTTEEKVLEGMIDKEHLLKLLRSSEKK